jgi:hypothetical protein
LCCSFYGWNNADKFLSAWNTLRLRLSVTSFLYCQGRRLAALEQPADVGWSGAKVILSAPSSLIDSI